MDRSCIVWMGNIQPEWDHTYLKSLFYHLVENDFSNQLQEPVSINIRRNARKGWNDSSGRRIGFALIGFSRKDDASYFLNTFNGLPIPDDQGHFCLKPNQFEQIDDEKGGSSIDGMIAQLVELTVAPLNVCGELPRVPDSIYQVDWNQDGNPPLDKQLEPLTIAQLRQRLVSFGVSEDNVSSLEEKGQRTGGRVAKKQALIKLMCALYGLAQFAPRFERKQIHLTGKPVPPNLLDPIASALLTMSWPKKSRNVNADEYLVLGIPCEGAKSRNTDKYSALWESCCFLIHSMAPAFVFTSIAVTKNFVGSPHVDMNDKSYQYAVSIGDFNRGGELCVEGNANEIFVVNTKNALAAIDGRYPHWVSSYEGNRYSLIYYRVDGSCSERGPAVVVS